MKQLSPRVQLALLDADYDTHIGRDGWPYFKALNAQNHEVSVSAAGDLISVEVRANGFVTGRHLDAADLESHSDEALSLMFRTIAQFA